MKLLLAIFLLLVLVGVGSAQTNVPPFPPNPIVGQEVTGPDGQIYTWDGTKWVAGVGPPAGPFAPQINPAGGANNYAPLASPTFTGTVNLANLTGTTTGTWTFPDGSTYTGVGHNNVLAMGIGVAAPAPTGALLQVQRNANSATAVVVRNNTAGTTAQSVEYFYNDQTATTNSFGAVSLTSSTFNVAQPVAQPAEAFVIGTSASRGMVLSAITPPIALVINSVLEASVTATGLVVNGSPNPLGVTYAWTPTMTGTGGNPTVTYNTQTARITYLGSAYLWSFYVGWTALTGGGGDLTITGLPVTQFGSNVLSGCGQFAGFTSPGAGYTVMAVGLAPGANVFGAIASGFGLGSAPIPLTDVQGSGYLLCEGWGYTA